MNIIKALLTGHTRGLGAALADNLLGRGIAVLGISRTRSAAHASGLLQEVELDLAITSAVETWIGTGALKRFVEGAHTVVLINNAGMLQPVGPIEIQDIGAIGRSVSLNVAAPLMLSAAVAAASTTARQRWTAESCTFQAARRAMPTRAGASTARRKQHSITTRAQRPWIITARCALAAWRRVLSIRTCKPRFAAWVWMLFRCAKNSMNSSAAANYPLPPTPRERCSTMR
ncbi:short chain dehydrogenase [Caballeronia sordidicola]|uniref:Short chain dehydrogenase n=1 Tax=Caballeronia sordidicola TaxID=196367 RepID=A0A158G9K8_CABSO|nr:short chain dehydrogenase [Caballeronia sordidicola]